MDRQNVEYIEREDDEEFDEFGRKKKRRRIEEVRHFQNYFRNGFQTFFFFLRLAGFEVQKIAERFWV